MGRKRPIGTETGTETPLAARASLPMRDNGANSIALKRVGGSSKISLSDADAGLRVRDLRDSEAGASPWAAR